MTAKPVNDPLILDIDRVVSGFPKMRGGYRLAAKRRRHTSAVISSTSGCS